MSVTSTGGNIARELFKSGNWGEATGPKGKYKIKVNTKDYSDLIVSVTDDKQKHKIPLQNVVWHGTKHKSKETLQTLINESKDRFEVEIVPDQTVSNFTVNIKLNHLSKQKSPLSSQEDKVIYRSKKHNKQTLVNCKDVYEFFEVCQEENPDPLVPIILKEMVKGFCNEPSPTTSMIHGIVKAIKYLPDEDILRVIEKLVQDASTNVMRKEPMLIGLTDIFTYLNRANLQEAFRKFEKNPYQDQDLKILLKDHPFCNLDSNKLVRLMDAVMDVLDNEEKNPETLIILLQTLIAIAEVMMVLEVTGLDKTQHHDKFVKTLRKFCDHKDCRVAFLSTYGEQCFTLITDNESKKQAFFRRAFHLFKGLAIIGRNISPVEPWAILGAVDSFEDLKKAFTLIQRKHAWFQKLRVLQELFLQKNSTKLTSFTNDVLNNPDRVRKPLPNSSTSKHFQFFVQGLVVLIKQVIDTIGTDEPQVAQAAFTLLMKIRSDNLIHPPQSSSLFFQVKDKQNADTIALEIYELLSVYQNHPNSNLVKEAKISLDVIHKLQTQTPLPQPTIKAQKAEQSESTNNLDQKDFFSKAAKSAASWIEGIQLMQGRLEKDPQVLEEWEYVIALKGKDSDSDTESELMEEKLSKVLKDEKNKMVVLLGDSGSGKSLFSKLHVAEGLDTFNSQNPIEIYVSMTTIKKPDGNLMEEVLDQLNLKVEEKKELQKRRVVLFVDSYDEWFIKGRNANGGLINLYEENHLSEFWPKLQLVVMVRRDFLQAKDRSYFTLKNGKNIEILLASLEKKDIKKLYLPKYIEVRNKRDPDRVHPPLKWADPQKYIDYIEKLSLWGTATNPFMLKVLCDTLPAIVERHEKESKGVEMQFKVTKEDLFDEFICQRYREEFQRQLILGSPIKSMDEYLDFALKLSKNMQYCGARSISQEQEELKRLEQNTKVYIKEQKKNIKKINQRLKKNGSEKMKKATDTMYDGITTANRNINEATEAPNQLWHQLFDNDARSISLRRACLLVTKKDSPQEHCRMEFMHASVYEHFRAIDEIGADKKRICERIREMENSIAGSSLLTD